MSKVTKVLIIVVVASLGLSIAGCSCRTWNNLWGAGQAEPAEVAFWDKDCKVVNVPEKQPVVEKKPVAKPKPKMDSSSVVYGCGVLKVEKMMPAEVKLNKPFDYYIKVTNLNDQVVEQIQLTEFLSDNFKYMSSDPEGALDGKMLMWVMPMLDAGASKKIKVTGVATSTDPLKHCANATYLLPACSMTNVVESKLAITKTAPAKVMVCDMIPVKYVVTNSGTGMTTGVIITEKMPEGLMTEAGAKSVKLDVGQLEPGQSKTFTIMAKAADVGAFESKAMAMADDNMKAESEMTKTVVVKPVLAITKKGRDWQYLGRNVTYDIVVENKGDAPAMDTEVHDMMPANAKFVKADMGGTVKANKVIWKLGTLEAGKSKALSVTYMPTNIAKVGGKAMAVADCAKAVDAAAMTDVRGISAVLLEVIDTADPIEVGMNETYRITVTNQGSAMGTNIVVQAVLADSMEYIGVNGATSGTIDGNTVTMKLDKLAPKAKAVWNVVVKAVEQGDVRFKVIMNSGQIESAVQETESTHFYD